MNEPIKAGDLAVVVHADHPENNGALVSVLRRYADGELVSGVSWGLGGGGCWVVESLGRKLVWGIPGETKCGKTIQRVFAGDRLKPIRDPGEGAVDEMLLLVGSPTKETA